jgi:hypothetical protein
MISEEFPQHRPCYVCASVLGSREVGLEVIRARSLAFSASELAPLDGKYEVDEIN